MVPGVRSQRATLFLSSLLVLLALASAPRALAAPPDEAHEYLIGLSLPAPESLSVPSGLSAEEAQAFARSVTRQTAEPLLAQLKPLAAAGQIAGVRVQPEWHAISLRNLGGEETRARLALLAGSGRLAQDDGGSSACLAAQVQGLADQVQALSRQPTATLPAADPSISIYAPPGSSYSYVTGSAAPNAAVHVQLLIGGAEQYTYDVIASAAGIYSVYPPSTGCGFAWRLAAGDTVAVTSGGRTASTMVANVTAWVDPFNETVAGVTAAGRQVAVHLWRHGSAPCTPQTHIAQATASAGGSFNVSFAGAANVDGRDYAIVYARDSGGNATFADVNAMSIRAQFGSQFFSGYLKPDVDFSATLRRGSEIASASSGRTAASAYYTAYFTESIRAGDVIEVVGGGRTLSLVAVDYQGVIDRATNRLSGVTGAGRQVTALFHTQDNTVLRTACAVSSACMSAVADGAGAFAFTTALDLARGDYAHVTVHDAAGNTQYADTYVPAMIADITFNHLSGYWPAPGAYVTATLRSGAGALKAEYPYIWSSAWDGAFDQDFAVAILPGDRIEVAGSDLMMSMVVQNLAARLDGATGLVSGQAAAGTVLALLSDFRRSTGGYSAFCAQQPVAGGGYSIPFGAAQPGGQDYASVWNSGPDGHYTYRAVYAFGVNAYKEHNAVSGYSETPAAAITVTLTSGSAIKAQATTTSSATGFWSMALTGTTAVQILAGDTLQVAAGDGDGVALTVPQLSAGVDVGLNAVVGQAPANQPVTAVLHRWYNYGEYTLARTAAAGASGLYVIPFGDQRWGYDCSRASVVGLCIQPAVRYYTVGEHQFYQTGPQPGPAPADAYEGDDTFSTATVTAGLQRHTFHHADDVDWLSFTVTAGDVARQTPFIIETTNLGWGMDTALQLFDSDGVTLLVSDDDSGAGTASLIRWTPGHAGVFYVRVRPFVGASTAYCDAVYDVAVIAQRYSLYTPVIVGVGRRQ